MWKMIPIKFNGTIGKGEELPAETRRAKKKEARKKVPEKLIRSSREVIHFSKDQP
jgi:hypothetical protein